MNAFKHPLDMPLVRAKMESNRAEGTAPFDKDVKESDENEEASAAASPPPPPPLALALLSSKGAEMDGDSRAVPSTPPDGVAQGEAGGTEEGEVEPPPRDKAVKADKADEDWDAWWGE
mmetsp:Transcript_7609/g.14324  ORF Transcript_7609/g.14324 Transcript_7609/m.14324 type:complete len:118 (-) Transcript_7609:672-1025(-)